MNDDDSLIFKSIEIIIIMKNLIIDMTKLLNGCINFINVQFMGGLISSA